MRASVDLPDARVRLHQWQRNLLTMHGLKWRAQRKPAEPAMYYNPDTGKLEERYNAWIVWAKCCSGVIPCWHCNYVHKGQHWLFHMLRETTLEELQLRVEKFAP